MSEKTIKLSDEEVEILKTTEDGEHQKIMIGGRLTTTDITHDT